MASILNIPRVDLPNATEEEVAGIAAAKELAEWTARQRTLFVRALLRKGRPFIGIRKSAPKPTKHQRHKAAVAVRSAYLKGVS